MKKKRASAEVEPAKLGLSLPCAEQFAVMVQIHLENGNWAAAHAAIDWAENRAKIKQQELSGDPYDWPLASLNLSLRTVNSLEEEGIFVVRDLLNARCTEAWMLTIPNFGPSAIQEVKAALWHVQQAVQRLNASQREERQRELEQAG